MDRIVDIKRAYEVARESEPVIKEVEELIANEAKVELIEEIFAELEAKAVERDQNIRSYRDVRESMIVGVHAIEYASGINFDHKYIKYDNIKHWRRDSLEELLEELKVTRAIYNGFILTFASIMELSHGLEINDVIRIERARVDETIEDIEFLLEDVLKDELEEIVADAKLEFECKVREYYAKQVELNIKKENTEAGVKEEAEALVKELGVNPRIVKLERADLDGAANDVLRDLYAVLEKSGYVIGRVIAQLNTLKVREDLRDELKRYMRKIGALQELAELYGYFDPVEVVREVRGRIR